MGDLPIGILVLIVNVLFTAGLGIIGWLVNKLWHVVQKGDENTTSEHNSVIALLKDIREEVQIIRRRVNGHAKRINRNHQLVREAHPNYATEAGEKGDLGKIGEKDGED